MSNLPLPFRYIPRHPCRGLDVRGTMLYYRALQRNNWQFIIRSPACIERGKSFALEKKRVAVTLRLLNATKRIFSDTFQRRSRLGYARPNNTYRVSSLAFNAGIKRKCRGCLRSRYSNDRASEKRKKSLGCCSRSWSTNRDNRDIRATVIRDSAPFLGKRHAWLAGKSRFREVSRAVLTVSVLESVSSSVNCQWRSGMLVAQK